MWYVMSEYEAYWFNSSLHTLTLEIQQNFEIWYNVVHASQADSDRLAQAIKGLCSCETVGFMVDV
jgi:hypothetical protein